MNAAHVAIDQDKDVLEKLNLKVKDVMHHDPLTIPSSAYIIKAAQTMDRHEHACLLVEEKGKVVGIITERDIVRRVAAADLEMHHTRVKRIMSTPIVVVDPNVAIEEALKLMAEHKIRRLPVVDHSGILGLITLTDIARGLAAKGVFANALVDAILRQTDAPAGIYK